MDELLWLLDLALRDLQAARRRAGSKKVRAHLRLALARITKSTTASPRNDAGGFLAVTSRAPR